MQHSLGFCLLLAWALHKVSGVAGSGRVVVFASVVVLIVGAYSARTVARNEGCKNHS